MSDADEGFEFDEVEEGFEFDGAEEEATSPSPPPPPPAAAAAAEEADVEEEASPSPSPTAAAAFSSSSSPATSLFPVSLAAFPALDDALCMLPVVPPALVAAAPPTPASADDGFASLEPVGGPLSYLATHSLLLKRTPQLVGGAAGDGGGSGVVAGVLSQARVDASYEAGPMWDTPCDLTQPTQRTAPSEQQQQQKQPTKKIAGAEAKAGTPPRSSPPPSSTASNKTASAEAPAVDPAAAATNATTAASAGESPSSQNRLATPTDQERRLRLKRGYSSLESWEHSYVMQRLWAKMVKRAEAASAASGGGGGGGARGGNRRGAALEGASAHDRRLAELAEAEAAHFRELAASRTERCRLCSQGSGGVAHTHHDARFLLKPVETRFAAENEARSAGLLLCSSSSSSSSDGDGATPLCITACGPDGERKPGTARLRDACTAVVSDRRLFRALSQQQQLQQQRQRAGGGGGGSGGGKLVDCAVFGTTGSAPLLPGLPRLPGGGGGGGGGGTQMPLEPAIQLDCRVTEDERRTYSLSGMSTALFFPALGESDGSFVAPVVPRGKDAKRKAEQAAAEEAAAKRRRIDEAAATAAAAAQRTPPPPPCGTRKKTVQQQAEAEAEAAQATPASPVPPPPPPSAQRDVSLADDALLRALLAEAVAVPGEGGAWGGQEDSGGGSSSSSRVFAVTPVVLADLSCAASKQAWRIFPVTVKRAEAAAAAEAPPVVVHVDRPLAAGLVRPRAANEAFYEAAVPHALAARTAERHEYSSVTKRPWEDAAAAGGGGSDDLPAPCQGFASNYGYRLCSLGGGGDNRGGGDAAGAAPSSLRLLIRSEVEARVKDIGSVFVSPHLEFANKGTNLSTPDDPSAFILSRYSTPELVKMWWQLRGAAGDAASSPHCVVGRVNVYTSSILAWDTLRLSDVESRLAETLGAVGGGSSAGVEGTLCASAHEALSVLADVPEGSYLLCLSGSGTVSVLRRRRSDEDAAGDKERFPPDHCCVSRVPDYTDHTDVAEWWYGKGTVPLTHQLPSQLSTFLPDGKNVLDVDVCEATSTFFVAGPAEAAAAADTTATASV